MTLQTHIAYYRVSTSGQSIDSQRATMGGKFNYEYSDDGVSGAIPALKRPGFAEMFSKLRAGDVVHVYAVDRLGRDAIDVQQTVRVMLNMGVEVDVHGLGRIAKGVGELILAVLAQVADMERNRIAERTKGGRELAEKMLAEKGVTQHGKKSMGRPATVDAAEVAAWRKANSASISKTAAKFEISAPSVKRLCAAVADPEKAKEKAAKARAAKAAKRKGAAK